MENKQDKPMLEVKLKKALYGTLQAALLFWKLLYNTLEEQEFKLSKYDQFLANKTINSKQSTIIRHVDNLKITTSKKVKEDIIKQPYEKFRKESH